MTSKVVVGCIRHTCYSFAHLANMWYTLTKSPIDLVDLADLRDLQDMAGIVDAPYRVGIAYMASISGLVYPVDVVDL